jgi:hypothetical protein
VEPTAQALGRRSVSAVATTGGALPLVLLAFSSVAEAQQAGRGAGAAPPSPASIATTAPQTGQRAVTVEKAPVAKGQWPKTLADGQREAAEKAAPAQWTAAEITAAKAQCAADLKGLAIVAIPVEPIRQGECGAAAPVRLVSIGKSPQVTFNPPPILTCQMVKGLATWLQKSVQPMAVRHLGKPIVQVDTMSDYSCRRAYGRAGNRLSEHARANALDIRSFLTATGATSSLAADWGPTARAVRARVAAAEKAKAKAEAQRKALAAKATKPTTAVATADTAKGGGGVASPAAPSNSLAGAMAEDTANGVGRLLSRSLMPSLAPDTKLGLSRLGGPVPPRAAFDVAETGPADFTTHVVPLEQAAEAKVITTAGPPRKPASAAKSAAARPLAPTPVGRQLFIRAIHASACTIFGTTLGPEANKAHEDHFHVDMAERRNGMKFCE